MKKFVIKLMKNGSEVSKLVYNLYDNVVVDDFLRAVDYGSDVPVYASSLVFTKSHIVDEWVEMYQLAKKLSNFSLYSDRIQYERCFEEGYSQDLLNHLHWFVEEFEILFYEGKIPDEDCDWVAPAVSRMNDLIHSMEGNLIGEGTGWLGFRMDPFLKIPLRDEHLPYFQDHYAKDKLFLGYSEVGKTLRHMYEANDIDGAQREQTNPKQHITNEVMLPFFEDGPFDFDNYAKWCQTYSTEDHTDKRQYCYFEIGELESKTPLREFDSILVGVLEP